MTLEQDKLSGMYYHMRLTRAIEERVRIMYREGKLPGNAYLSTGQEAISVGIAYGVEPDDILAISYRDLGTALVRGVPLAAIFARYMARKTALTTGKDVGLHAGVMKLGLIWPMVMLASNIPIAAGVAYALKAKGKKNIALAVFGDGSSNKGDFHEGVNLAAVKKLPVVYVCTNNQYAVSTPTKESIAIENIAERAQGYGIPGQVVEGNNVLAVCEAVAEAATRARAGQGPSLIECKTMRMAGHSERDDLSYVPESLLKEWRKKDPILGMESYLTEKRILTKKLKDEISARIASEIDQAVEGAQRAPLPEPEEILDSLYA